MSDDMDRYSRSAAAARLKTARAARFPTAAGLARAVHMKEVTVRAHENGQNGMGLKNAQKYARELGVSAEWLLYGRESAEQPASMGPARLARDRSEMNIETIRRRVPIWQEAREGVFQRVPPYNATFAEGFLTLMPTGYEAIDADAFRISDDHASSAYSPGSFVISAPPTQMDLREGDHIVLARILPRGSLAETTVRGVRLIGNEVHFTSLREGADPAASIGHMTAIGALPVFVDMRPSRKRNTIGNALTEFARNFGSAITDPDDTSERLQEEIDELTLDEAEQQRVMEASAQFEFEATAAGFPPRFANLSGSEALVPIGVVLATYKQRERSGPAIAHWDRQHGVMEPIAPEE